MKKLRVGVVGCGSISKFHLDAYRKNTEVELMALCDVNKARAEEVAAECGIGKVFTDYMEMIKCSDLDAISVTTWNNTHAPVATAALEAGINVLCEKPLALNAIEAEDMVKTAKKMNKLLMVGVVRRYGSNTQFVKELIDDGELGEIYYAKVGFNRRCGNPGGWFADKKRSGGGPLIDLGVHVIDLALYFMDNPEIQSIFGNTYKRLGAKPNIKGYSWYKSADFTGESDVEDSANGMIKFKNGASLFVETSWVQNIKQDELYIELYGDKAGIVIEPQIEIFSEKNNHLINIKPVFNESNFDFEESFRNEINHFVDCILNGTKCISPAEDGLKVMKIIDGIYLSGETGELIMVDE